MNKLKTILLLDDNMATNYINKRFINESECTDQIIDFDSGIDALNYLNKKENPFPELIFLDVRMPQMNAWEFLTSFNRIKRTEKQNAKVVILATSVNKEIQVKATRHNLVKEILLKPLVQNKIDQLLYKLYSK